MTGSSTTIRPFASCTRRTSTRLRCLHHIGNLGDVFGKLLETGGGCSFEVFGNPSRELRDAVSGLDLTVFAHFQGK